VCGRSARTVWRGEGPKPIGPSYPYRQHSKRKQASALQRGARPATKPFGSRIRPNRLEEYQNPLASVALDPDLVIRKHGSRDGVLDARHVAIETAMLGVDRADCPF